MENVRSPLVKCIILAAGASTRLRAVSNNLPKCLIPVGGQPLLERTLKNVLSAGVQRIEIVLGYKASEVRDFVKKHFPFHNIRFAVNPKFETTNNAFSLLMAREFYLEEKRKGYPLERLLLLDCDIVFSADLLPFFLEEINSDGLAVRTKGDHDEEEIKVQVDSQNNVLRIDKGVPLKETYGESIGIEAFSSGTSEQLFRVLERRVKEGCGRTEFYEASFQELINGGVKMKAVDISHFPAAEIDTPEDLAFVEKHLIPKIDRHLPTT